MREARLLSITVSAFMLFGVGVVVSCSGDDSGGAADTTDSGSDATADTSPQDSAPGDAQGSDAGTPLFPLVANGDTTCLVRGGTMKCWGGNNYGNLGRGSVSPSGPTGVVPGI